MALVAAMAGGAIAASGALTGKQKKEVEKIAKKYAGKPGAAGAAGPAGPAGAKGDTGAAGVAGKDGATGPAGSQGATGPQGPAGSQGPAGQTGFTETLPAGKTETGVWGVGPLAPGAAPPLAPIKYFFPISFPIPLKTAPEVVIVKPEEESKPGCPGRGGGTFEEGYVPTTPMADPGKLCIYMMPDGEGAGVLTGASTYEYEGFEEFAIIPGASTAGTVLAGRCDALCSLAGSWAVTAPEE
ncbi:MAG TPA: hypothetical protein VIT89_04095 [Solirubrobacterales bacterium]